MSGEKSQLKATDITVEIEIEREREDLVGLVWKNRGFGGIGVFGIF